MKIITSFILILSIKFCYAQNDTLKKSEIGAIISNYGDDFGLYYSYNLSIHSISFNMLYSIDDYYVDNEIDADYSKAYSLGINYCIAFNNKPIFYKLGLSTGYFYTNVFDSKMRIKGNGYEIAYDAIRKVHGIKFGLANIFNINDFKIKITPCVARYSVSENRTNKIILYDEFNYLPDKLDDGTAVYTRFVFTPEISIGYKF